SSPYESSPAVTRGKAAAGQVAYDSPRQEFLLIIGNRGGVGPQDRSSVRAVRGPTPGARGGDFPRPHVLLLLERPPDRVPAQSREIRHRTARKWGRRERWPAAPPLVPVACAGREVA